MWFVIEAYRKPTISNLNIQILKKVICIWVYMCAYKYMCIYEGLYIYMHIYICKYIYMHIYLYVHICIYIYNAYLNCVWLRYYFTLLYC